MFSSNKIFDDDYISDSSFESDSDGNVQCAGCAPASTVIDSENDDAFFGSLNHQLPAGSF